MSANLGSVCVLLPSSTCRVSFAVSRVFRLWRGGGAIDSFQFVHIIEEPSKIRSKKISEKPNRRSRRVCL